MPHPARLFALGTAAILGTFAPAAAADPPVNFARDVQPILSEYCFHCHGPDQAARKGDLRLDTHKDALAVVKPGKSADSELVKRVLSADPAETMPPPKSKKKLSPAQIETLKRWIDDGAKWGTHWAFAAPQRPLVPATKAAVRNPIDNFVFARLDHEGLKPSAEADKTTLIRRATLDLTGLPPTPKEVDDFVADPSPTAFETVVDRLLKSPRYGERMVWEWLDAARYADSNGYQGDGERTMWPWRDWAVTAFNDDMPFDEFTRLQLAGDLLPNATTGQKLATGFLRNHMINGEGGRIAEENRVDYVMDMTETVGTVWLGLTLNCCRCHDHKFDPVLQKEYYSLFAYFNQTPVNGGGGDPQTKPVVELATHEQTAKLKEVADKIAAAATGLDEFEATFFPREKGKPAAAAEKAKDLPKDVKDALGKPANGRNRNQLGAIEKHFAKTDPDYIAKLKALNAALGDRDGINSQIPRVMVMEDMPKPRDSFVYVKGLYNKPADKVTAGVPAVLPPLAKGAAANRLALANWLVSPEHPLTARVTVNRLWQQVFGVGLVKTVEDFGVQGERPGNQELLDWLAVEFRESGWSQKKMLRLILTSAAYRQSSKVTPALAERDPENRLLARGPRFRMPSWMIRDQALAASGLLVEKPGGPPVKPYQPPGIWEEATFGGKRYTPDTGESLYRRSVYTFWRRIVGPTMFFDAGARQTCTVKTARTNTPLQALATLNDTTYVEAARVLAEKVLSIDGDDGKRIEAAFRRVLARKPRADETTVLLAGLKRMRLQYTSDPDAAKKLLAVGAAKRNEKLNTAEHAAFTNVCAVILNLDEAVTKE